MKTLVALAAMSVLVFCGPTMADPIDPDPDGMSIYFDQGATTFCAEAPVGVYTPITAYLILTNPSTEMESILLWEARLEVEANPVVSIPPWSLPIGASNFGALPDHVVPTTNPPLALTGNATVLASITLTFLGDEVDPYAIFTISGVPSSLSFPWGPGYAAQVGEESHCQHIFGAWGTPCAWINGNCDPISNQDMTWGSLKSLF